jgi:SAM-dependent methyltransferase
MLGVAAAAIPTRTRAIVDLGIGTGALSARCLVSAPDARVVGIDVDPAIVALAAKRLHGRAYLRGRVPFLRAPAAALRRGGRVVLAPPCPDPRGEGHALPAHSRGASSERPLHHRRLPACERRRRPPRPAFEAWLAHLRRSYTRARSAALLHAWADEDVYVPLDGELELMRRSGFDV